MYINTISHKECLNYLDNHMQGGIKLILGQVCIGKRVIKCRRVPHNMSNHASMHWGEKAQWTKAWKEEVWAQFMMQRSKLWKLPLKNASITINIYTISMKDQDGAYGSIKPILDALKVNGGVGVIVDDSPKYINLNVEQIKVAHRADEHVEILIKKLC